MEITYKMLKFCISRLFIRIYKNHQKGRSNNMTNCFLTLNKNADPIIRFEFEEKDFFEFGNKAYKGFSKVYDEEGVEEFLLIKDFGKEHDYSILISEDYENVFIKVVFDVPENIFLTGKSRKMNCFMNSLRPFKMRIKVMWGLKSLQVRKKKRNSFTLLHFVRMSMWIIGKYKKNVDKTIKIVKGILYPCNDFLVS